MPYILASASPRRQELLHKITDDFIIQPADVDETIPDDILPEDAAVYLSHIKAEAVSNQYPGSIVIGCDTIVLLNDQILGKPHSPEQAREMLQMLSGNRFRSPRKQLCSSIRSQKQKFPLIWKRENRSTKPEHTAFREKARC